MTNLTTPGHYDEDVWNDDGDGDGDDADIIGFHLAVHSDHSDHMNCSGSWQGFSLHGKSFLMFKIDD